MITELTESSRISWFIDNQEFANFPDGYLHNITSTNNQLSARYENEGDSVSGDVESVFFMIQFTGEWNMHRLRALNIKQFTGE